MAFFLTFGIEMKSVKVKLYEYQNAVIQNLK